MLGANRALDHHVDNSYQLNYKPRGLCECVYRNMRLYNASNKRQKTM